ncbi:MAG: uroporphyrinogen-III C-methyltransferase [Beijerinckiaceae bacterium]
MVGTVYLVGAGPGAADLLTLRALRIVESADVVVYDRLVSSDTLDLAPAAAPRIDVGKRSGDHPTPQHEINELLVRLARRYPKVVRLKGGDPLMFGRGGEEIVHLARAGVPFDIVPGITAAQGAAASLGVPLTHRDCAGGVRYVSGHMRENGKLDLDWRGLADSRTTLAVYMGLSEIDKIAKSIVECGRDSMTPAVAVSNATRGNQRRVFGTLDDIGRRVREEALESPVLFLIGEVVNASPVRVLVADVLREALNAAPV